MGRIVPLPDGQHDDDNVFEAIDEVIETLDSSPNLLHRSAQVTRGTATPAREILEPILRKLRRPLALLVAGGTAAAMLLVSSTMEDHVAPAASSQPLVGWPLSGEPPPPQITDGGTDATAAAAAQPIAQHPQPVGVGGTAPAPVTPATRPARPATRAAAPPPPPPPASPPAPASQPVPPAEPQPATKPLLPALVDPVTDTVDTVTGALLA